MYPFQTVSAIFPVLGFAPDSNQFVYLTSERSDHPDGYTKISMRLSVGALSDIPLTTISEGLPVILFDQLGKTYELATPVAIVTYAGNPDEEAYYYCSGWITKRLELK